VKVEHLKQGPQNVRFQEHAFDAALGSSKRKKEFSTTLDDFATKEPEGFQVVESTSEKLVPDWVYIKKDIQKVLLAAFPKLHTNPSHRRKAGRWAQVINLYYLQGMTAEEVAEKLFETRAVIKRLIISISRIQKGLTVDGCPRKK
jgi:hypothetical protein